MNNIEIDKTNTTIIVLNVFSAFFLNFFFWGGGV